MMKEIIFKRSLAKSVQNIPLGFIQTIGYDSHLHFEPTIIQNSHLWESPPLNWNLPKNMNV